MRTAASMALSVKITLWCSSYLGRSPFNIWMVLRHLTKEQAKEEVKKLVDKYNRILESGSIKRYKEEDTKAEFIEPLFEALGWDVRNINIDELVYKLYGITEEEKKIIVDSLK